MRQLPQKKNGKYFIFGLENKLSNSDFSRDVTANILSVVNVIVLLGLRTANTQLVRNGPKFRFWRTISVDSESKPIFRSFRTHKHQALGDFICHKCQPLV